MGWSRAVYIFDEVAGALLDVKTNKTPKEVLFCLAEVLEANDWDTQQCSDYYDHPVVQEVFKELHPEWFDEDGE